MDSNPIVFIDSGVGGLPYYGAFHQSAPAIPAIYVADCLNFPYGPKSKDELVAILERLIGRVVGRFSPRLVVIACNTASVSALDALRKKFSGLPFVGTVPAVKPAALFSRKRRVGVLATERTVNDPYVALLAERFAPDCELVGIAAPELVKFVEREYPSASSSRRYSYAASYVEQFRKKDVDAIVLGCTHFLFLADEFQRAAAPDITVFDSREGVVQRALSLLDGLGTNPVAPIGSSAASAGSLFATCDPPYISDWETFARLYGIRFAGALEKSV